MGPSPRNLAEVMQVAAASPGGLVDVNGGFASWREIAHSVELAARGLIGSGVAPGDRVVIAQPRSRASYVAVHGSLAAGAVMVPVDPKAANDRMVSVLELSEPTVIISDHQAIVEQLRPWADAHSTPILSVADLAGSAVASTTLPELGRDDPAYILFTSGSTGVPKGMLHTHGSALAYAQAAIEIRDLQPSDRLAATSALHFDQSTLALYAAPLAGATVVQIGGMQLAFPASLTKRIEADRITMLYTVPYLLRELVARGALERFDLSSMRLVSYGGESMTADLLNEVLAAFPNADALNVYGPAEVNAVTSHRSQSGDVVTDPIPIGRPWPAVGVRITVDGTAVAQGAVGELSVSAASMMQQYWRDPAKTTEAIEVVDGERFYRTGDLVSQTADGELLFHGRADNMVKVRGTRIELDEIEAVLSDQPGVRHAIAGTRGPATGADAIVAGFVPETDTSPDVEAIIAACRRRLPAAAVPEALVKLADVPLTATGKLDRSTVRRRLQEDHR